MLPTEKGVMLTRPGEEGTSARPAAALTGMRPDDDDDDNDAAFRGGGGGRASAEWETSARKLPPPPSSLFLLHRPSRPRGKKWKGGRMALHVGLKFSLSAAAAAAAATLSSLSSVVLHISINLPSMRRRRVERKKGT